MDEREAERQHTEQVDVLVDSVASNGREAQLINELAADVDNLALQSTALQGLGAGSLEVL
jgi:predicted lipoprotein